MKTFAEINGESYQPVIRGIQKCLAEGERAAMIAKLERQQAAVAEMETAAPRYKRASGGSLG